MAKQQIRKAGLRVTLKDVAHESGVSVMTVSNVINGRLERVSSEVARKVRKVVSDMGYRPQLSGRSLRLRRNFALGLVIQHPDRRFLDDPYITQVAAGMSNHVADQGYGLLVHGVQSEEQLDRMINSPRGYDGFAVMVSGAMEERHAIYRRLATKQMPMLIIQDKPPADLLDVSSVLQDDEGGAEALTRLLLEAGARHLLCVLPTRTWPAIERRVAGIVRTAGGRAEVSYLTCSEENFDSAVEEIVSRLRATPSVDAIMGGNDQLGIAAVRAAEKLAIRIPDRMQVTGFNAFEAHRFVQPALTSVSSPAYDIGQAASRLLMAHVEDQSEVPVSLELAVRVSQGGTTRPLAPVVAGQAR